MTCPPECRVTTEIMTSWRDLWRQRLRWHRGALENIAAYGLTRATAMYWGQQLGLAYGVLALQSYLVLMTVSLLAADSLRWSPFWVCIGMIFVVERIVTVVGCRLERPGGRRADRPRARVRAVPAGVLRDLDRADPPRAQGGMELRAHDRRFPGSWHPCCWATGSSSPGGSCFPHRS